ncbi:MAG TPA: LPS assembly protein LptD [Solimonas sp.]|nr:LPS assembly protein LptD [Solimonas sp.]
MLRSRFLSCAALAAACLAGSPARAAEGSCPQLDNSLPELEFSTDPRVFLSADEVSLEKDGLSNLLGSVRLRQGDKEFSAEALDYDSAAGEVRVEADSLFRNKELVIRSKGARFRLSGESGSFSGTQFTLPQRSARGSADDITLGREGTADLAQVRYTTCAPGSDAWYLEAGSISLDHESGLGTARNARLRFFGVPFLYAPWFQFPIDDRRRSGLLFPTIGESDKTGWDLRVPLYLNLAPNYDLMLTPRYMSDRGIQLATTGRYLLPRAEGKLGYEYLPDDRRSEGRRDYAWLTHQGLVNRRLAVDLRYAEVSDPRYFEDLGGNVDLSSTTHLERSARFTYQAPAAYTITALLQDYQTITSTLTAVDDPYRRLPQLRVDALTRNSLWDTRLGVSGEYVNFVRSNSVQGQRIDVHPYLRLDKDRVSWFARSQLDFRYTAYELTDTPPGQQPQVDRGLPLFSAEYGLRFERLSPGGKPQTLEPRLFYLYVPYERQDDLPVFDGGEPDFDFTQLFARNRFSGEDRISDANHITAALTGRQLDASTGEVKVAASLGQLFRFEAPRVTLPGEPAPDSGATDFIGNVDYYLSSRWGARLATQWSPENSEFNRSSVVLRYRDGPQRFEFAYRYRRELLEQADVIVQTPLFGGFSLAGRWRYSLPDEKTLDAHAGLQYDTCCWTARTAYRRYIASSDGEINTGVYLQLELKGLARLGSGFQNLFPAEDVY